MTNTPDPAPMSVRPAKAGVFKRLSLVWFGIVSVVAAEIGLLTPPLGLSCFVIKATLDDDRISLKDVFLGALPFAFVMLLVLILLIRFPILSLAILN